MWGCPRPSALLRAGVGLSRGPLRFRAAHRSRWSRPSHPSATSADSSDTAVAHPTPPGRTGRKKAPRHPSATVARRPAQPLRYAPPHRPTRRFTAGLGLYLPHRFCCCTGQLPLVVRPSHHCYYPDVSLRAGCPAAWFAYRPSPPTQAACQPRPIPPPRRQRLPTFRTTPRRPAARASPHRTIRPASRKVYLGSTPAPRYHAPADARSSSSGSAASRWSATTPS